jgi:hypothetical protein
MDQTDHAVDANRAAWAAFRDRVAEALGVARSAVTNVVSALATVTVAIVGAAVTLATAKLEATPAATAMLLAITGAGSAAIVLLIVLAVEAIRATYFADKWQKLYVASYQKASAGQQPPPIPWDELNKSRFSVSIHLKVSLPVLLFVAGLVTAAFVIAHDLWKRL